jgi:hypothetical protein
MSDTPGASVNGQPPDMRAAAAELIAGGWGVNRIDPHTKRAAGAEWPTRSRTPDEFRPGEHLGLMGGPASHWGRPGELAALGVDLDADLAIQLAPYHLPFTPAMEGRPSKPHSHLWYAVPLAGIPPEWRSCAPQAAPAMVRLFGHPGPCGRSYRGPDGKELLALKGTGLMMAAPPSTHPSGEARAWVHGRPHVPTVCDFLPLVRQVEALARAAGWVSTGARRAAHAGRAAAAADPGQPLPPFLTAREDLRRAAAYVDKLPRAVAHQGGHNATFRASNVIVWGFAFDPAGDDAWTLIERFNLRCVPPWTVGELDHKLETDSLDPRSHRHPRGHLLLRNRRRPLFAPVVGFEAFRRAAR